MAIYYHSATCPILTCAHIYRIVFRVLKRLLPKFCKLQQMEKERNANCCLSKQKIFCCHFIKSHCLKFHENCRETYIKYCKIVFDGSYCKICKWNMFGIQKKKNTNLCWTCTIRMWDCVVRKINGTLLQVKLLFLLT